MIMDLDRLRELFKQHPWLAGLTALAFFLGLYLSSLVAPYLGL